MSVLSTYQNLARWPAGRWLFSRLVCWKAPYFSSIAPRIETLEPGRCIATLRHRRAVTNHIGTVHAIALCNLAEFTGGLACDATIPASMRWIPKGMAVAYLKKAMGFNDHCPHTMKLLHTAAHIFAYWLQGFLALPQSLIVVPGTKNPVVGGRGTGGAVLRKKMRGRPPIARTPV